MRSVELVVRNPSGLHARPAALFVRTAGQFRSRITVENLTSQKTADAKSLLLVLTTGVQRGHRIRIAADGPDEAEAIAALSGLVASGLGEALEAEPSEASATAGEGELSLLPPQEAVDVVGVEVPDEGGSGQGVGVEDRR